MERLDSNILITRSNPAASGSDPLWSRVTDRVWEWWRDIMAQYDVVHSHAMPSFEVTLSEGNVLCPWYCRGSSLSTSQQSGIYLSPLCQTWHLSYKSVCVWLWDTCVHPLFHSLWFSLDHIKKKNICLVVSSTGATYFQRGQQYNFTHVPQAWL